MATLERKEGKEWISGQNRGPQTSLQAGSQALELRASQLGRGRRSPTAYRQRISSHHSAGESLPPPSPWLLELHTYPSSDNLWRKIDIIDEGKTSRETEKEMPYIQHFF